MSTREIAEQIVSQVAVGCWQFQSPGHLTELINMALAKAIADERERQWQPIETAPRDEGYYKLVARFEDEKLLWWEKAKPYQGSQWKSRGGFLEPTHWREIK